ncbi:conserved hypothetical protein [Clostridium perfringens D str. JGS1721]|uniref:BppU N-terminal domain-containing protein n=1 Tax=Clostridium perfringens D str. JGS1721 TaxID=488537 RepID=B1V2P9_CLOPF|nr:BppU family phage baseplate upper protein [Clostridium perfringens]EDT71907.1 conserved hypothetical protein [Clostridium perfringens D str. JGS1721]
MAKKYIDLVLDTIESDYSPVGVVKQLDSVIFNITVTENSTIKSLNNQNIKLFCKKPDKTKVEQTEGIDITNSTNGELTIDLKNSALQAVGLVYFELELKDSEGTISTANFIIRVDEKLGSDEAIESTNEFDTFEKIKLEEEKRQEAEKERDKIFKELITEGTEFNGSLENNINLAETLNTNLAENIKLADPLNTSLNEKIPEAATKKTELESSITKAKEFIDGLDGSQNIPQLRLDVTQLQNTLKENQSIEYEGNSIRCDNTLEGRTENLKVKGLTLLNYARTNTPVLISTGYRIPIDYLGLENGETYSFYVTYLPKGATWSVNNPSVDTSFTEDKLKVRTLNKEFDNNFKSISIKCSNIILEEAKKTKLIILKGDWRNKEVPTYFEGIKSFGEAEQEGDKYKISILSCGKNILKPLKNYSTINGFNLNNILKNGVQYTVTNTKNQLVKIAEFKDADTFLGQSTNGKFTFTFDNSKQQKLYIWKKYDSQVAELFTNEDIDFVMIEEGTGTIFEPYKEDKKDILISAPLPGFDFGEDIMYEDNGQVKITRNIDTYTFTGDETMRDTTEQDEKSGTGKYKVFALTVNKTIDINKNINNNFFKKQFNVAFQNMDSEGLAVTQYGIYIKILKSKLSTQDIEGLKAWLKANTTTIYFARATPVTEIVENCIDIDLDTFQDKTYFSIENSLPGTLDFKVPSNIGSVVQNMAKEINNIWDVINNLLVPGLVDTKRKFAEAAIKNNLK